MRRLTDVDRRSLAVSRRRLLKTGAGGVLGLSLPQLLALDYGATIYEKLGIDRNQPLHTATNRPVLFGHPGEPIPQLFS